MAGGKNPNLQGGRELPHLAQKDPYLGSILRRIINAVNTTSQNAGVSAIGKLPPPLPLQGINVAGTQAGDTITVPGEILHFTLQHDAPLTKGVRYFSEYDTNPNFTQPHVIDHGTSRTGNVNLPTMNSDGDDHTYYLRSYAQYPGSDPHKPLVLGGLNGPLKIKMGGATQMNLLSSTGSGTAAPNGTQGGKGLGVNLKRPAVGPKRNLEA